MVKLLFSDIDGTLINSALTVTPRTRDAIRKQVVTGNIFVPVSARMPQAIMTVVGQIMQSCPMVAYNGALVLDELGQPLYSKSIASSQAASICAYLEQEEKEIVWNVYSGANWFYYPGNNIDRVLKEEIVQLKASPSSVAEVEQLPGVHKILLMGQAAALDVAKQNLAKLHPDLFLVKSAPTLLEIMVKKVNKGAGVRILAEELKVRMDDCWAFGDNYNDAAMLKAVGHPYLMGNAPAELKREFANITLDNNHDGIAAVLDAVD
ncbi:Cof-type HAD-IIB family hydrolase [Lactobacillus xylocopicola]|uniref:Hydrolase n=1 Tax=Lactobacillus xylocopicola TaxID=2976676 RepID=A0ABM8BIU7_9LACO|nr:Cof-type HAD-IIB family hydrolase [Lactobacillus xylocopicola]BDR61236.1 hydrolase [Lactobacillus xylocopicola]